MAGAPKKLVHAATQDLIGAMLLTFLRSGVYRSNNLAFNQFGIGSYLDNIAVKQGRRSKIKGSWAIDVGSRPYIIFFDDIPEQTEVSRVFEKSFKSLDKQVNVFCGLVVDEYYLVMMEEGDAVGNTATRDDIENALYENIKDGENIGDLLDFVISRGDRSVRTNINKFFKTMEKPVKKFLDTLLVYE